MLLKTLTNKTIFMPLKTKGIMMPSRGLDMENNTADIKLGPAFANHISSQVTFLLWTTNQNKTSGYHGEMHKIRFVNLFSDNLFIGRWKSLS